FYYLHRTAGMNFGTELENNSFAKLVMANTDATHLPGRIFLTGLVLEADQTKQFNAGLGDADPLGDSVLTPLVIRDNPATPGPDTNYLHYTGAETVVLGGTPNDDVLIAGDSDDDTIWGDAGNDRLDGGYGNDEIEGGEGDDIITDIGGDDVLKGGPGNDVIHGGNGLNLIMAGPGSDFIVTGEDSSEVIAGGGNDFILGSKLNVQMAGNEGNDWIEIGTQDGAPGDNFDPLGRDLIAGHDVFLGDGGFDEMIGEGGDDIMVGSGGPDKMKGMSGFDWATFKNDRSGVSVDFFHNAFVDAPQPLSTAAVAGRFAMMEGLSGSPFGDILRGDDADALGLPLAGAQGSVLTNIDLIDGLQELLGAGVTSFGAGNIILGGDGSDIIEGRRGDDLIDGDKWLNVRISVRDANNLEIRSADSVNELVPDMLAGTYNPSQLQIVREILPGSGGFDTAMFSDIAIQYLISDGPDGSIFVTHLSAPGGGGGIGGVLGNQTDGTDHLVNIERLQFADQSIVLVPGLNAEPVGRVAILDAANAPDTTPVTGQVLRASIAGVSDGDNPGGSIGGHVIYTWQYEPVAGSGSFLDISGALGAGAPSAIGPTFTVTPNLQGFALRVKAQYQDAHGVFETVFSSRTAAVAAGTPAPAPAPLMTGEQTGVVSPGVHFIGSDLQFILDQIVIAEKHAAGESLTDLLPNVRVPFGLRSVDGSSNNLVKAQTEFGAADNVFPRLLDPVFNAAENVSIDLDGPGPLTVGTPTSYTQTSGFV
ncbi:MAG: heme peroxidase, partial [Betaproteobacteria bacterium]|nr:heme peroxidase [Betaproteobacteria bacterium]